MIGMGAGADRITYGFFLSMAALLMALVLGPVQARAADERVPFTPPSMTPSLGAFGDSGRPPQRSAIRTATGIP